MTILAEFLGDLADALFPTTLVLLAAAGAWQRTAWRTGPGLRLVLVAIAVALLLRLGFAFAAVPVSTRYFLGLAVLVLPLAAAGLDPVADWLARLLRRAGRDLSPAAVRTAVLVLVVLPCLGKGLKPDKYAKPWLAEFPRLMVAEAQGAPTVLASELDDLRLAHFAGARHLKLCRDGEVICRFGPDGSRPRRRCFGGELAEAGRREFSEHWLELPGPQGWEHLAARLAELPGPVFLVVARDPEVFRAEFDRRGLPFPFRRLREFRDRHGAPFILYRFAPDA